MIKVDVEKNLLSAHGPIRLKAAFEINGNELITVYGPSGAGKTTILRMLAGLTTPDAGMIEVDGVVWFDSSKKIDLPVQKRSIGFVFQDFNLFPNMTIRQNLEFAAGKNADGELIDSLLEMVHLKELANRSVQNISGGQKQRVALIRALVRKPKIFLLDEPLSALDTTLRLKLQDDILELYRKACVPTIFVTHDIGEIFKISEKVFVLENGVITHSGTPQDIFGQDHLSGKFKFVGTVLDIVQEDFIFIVSVQVGQTVVKTVATKGEIDDIKIGDKVIVAAKAFNPVIMKVPSR